MPRTRAGTVPKLQHHRATGQARVKIAGRDYCGSWGSKAAVAKYQRLIAEYLNGNEVTPVFEAEPASRVSPSPPGVVRRGCHRQKDARCV